MASSVEQLLVRIDATSEQLRRELNRADSAMVKSDQTMAKRLQNMRKNFNKTAANAAKFGAAVTAAGAAITAKLVSAGLESVDSLAKVSHRLGIATEDLAALRFAAEQTGVSTSTLDMALQRMTRRVAEAAQGTGEAKGAIAELGLSAEELAELAPDQIFRKITDAMEGVGNQSDKVRLAMKLFDSEGVSLVQTMAAGTQGLDEFAEQARIAGLTISQFDAAKVEAANDAMNRVSKVFQGLSQHLAVKFAPVLEAVADRLFGVGKESGGAASIATKAFNAMVKGAGLVGNAIAGLQAGWLAMKAFFAEMARTVVTGLDKIAEAAIWVYNKMPWTDPVQYNSLFDGFLLSMESSASSARQSMDEILSRPLPSDALEDFVSETERQFSATAIAVGTAKDVMDEAGAAAVDLSKTQAKAAQETQSAWSRALQDVAARIDESFSGAWKGAFDSFNDFADGLKDAFKNLLGELAHLAITRPILVQMSAAMGVSGMSASAAASGFGGVASGAGGIMSALSAPGGVLSTISGSITGLADGAYNLLADGAYALGLENIGLNARGSVGMGLGGVAMNAGAGFLGGFAGNAVFGDTSGIGSTIGGFAGSIFGPLGAGIGSFLGAGAEKLLGDLFGFGDSKPDFASAYQTLDLSNGGAIDRGLFGTGDTAAVAEGLDSLSGMLATFADAVGAEGLLRVGVNNRGTLSVADKEFTDQDAFLDAAFDQIIKQTRLSEVIRNLLTGFEGTTEEMVAFADAIVGISTQIDRNVVTQVKDAAASTLTLSDAYYQQIDAIRQMAEGFDGSASSAVQLNQALAQNQSVAAQLAANMLEVSGRISGLFENSAQAIRESVMTEGELYTMRRTERDQLRASLGSLTDAAEIEKVASQINALNNSLFRAIGDPTKQTAEYFASFAERTSQIAQDRLSTLANDLESSQAAQNDRLRAMLDSAADQQMAAANQMYLASQTMLEASRSERVGYEQALADVVRIVTGSQQGEVVV